MFAKKFIRKCDYTPVIQLDNNGDGIHISIKEEEDPKFTSVCLSQEDVNALIKMLQEIGD